MSLCAHPCEKPYRPRVSYVRTRTRPPRFVKSVQPMQPVQPSIVRKASTEIQIPKLVVLHLAGRVKTPRTCLRGVGTLGAVGCCRDRGLTWARVPSRIVSGIRPI